MKNPFRVGGPIQEPSFFVGREEIVEYITRKMVELEHVLLYGERGTGKTSLLLYLAHPDSEISYPEYHIPVYFNFESVTEASEADVWQAIAIAIAQQMKQRYPEREAERSQFLVTIAEFIDISKTTPLFATGFGRALSRLDMAGFKIHFLFDEFDQSAINPHLGDSFYSTLRSLPKRGGNVSYIVAARTGLELIQQSYNKMRLPFFSLFLCKILKPFGEDEVYRLIFSYFTQAGLDLFVAEKLCHAAPFLYQTTGYHPFFLQALCYHLYARLDNPDWPRGVAKEEALRAFERHAKEYFEYYWNISSKEEQKLMKELASGQSVESQRQRVLAYRLEDRSLVIQTDSGWHLFSSVFEQWINENTLDEQLQASFSTLPDYQQAFRKLSVFRYLSKGILEQLLIEVKNKPDWHHLNRITDQVELLWERLTDTPLLDSDFDNSCVLSHRITPYWRHLGNLLLQATNLALYQRLHKDARTVFEHFAFRESMYDTTLRMHCFCELVYHLTQEAQFPPSEESAHKLTEEVKELLNRFFPSLKGDELLECGLEYRIEQENDLRDVLKQVGESNIISQLRSIISTTTLPSKPEAIEHDELVYA